MNVLAKLKELEELQHNWDSHGARPPDLEIIKSTIALILGLAVICPMPQNVVPTAKGGDRRSTRLNSSHIPLSRMPSSA